MIRLHRIGLNQVKPRRDGIEAFQPHHQAVNIGDGSPDSEMTMKDKMAAVSS
jgi:hypothetical protein